MWRAKEEENFCDIIFRDFSNGNATGRLALHVYSWHSFLTTKFTNSKWICPGIPNERWFKSENWRDMKKEGVSCKKRWLLTLMPLSSELPVGFSICLRDPSLRQLTPEISHLSLSFMWIFNIGGYYSKSQKKKGGQKTKLKKLNHSKNNPGMKPKNPESLSQSIGGGKPMNVIILYIYLNDDSKSGKVRSNPIWGSS